MQNLLLLRPLFYDQMNTEQKDRIQTAKRKADTILEKTLTEVYPVNTDTVKMFLELRLRYVREVQNVLAEEIKAMKEMVKNGNLNEIDYKNGIEVLVAKRTEVEFEEGDLLLQGANIQEELFDNVVSMPDRARGALIFDLHRKPRMLGEEAGEEFTRTSFSIMGDREKFKKQVHGFYGSTRVIQKINYAQDVTLKYCVVTGQWYDKFVDRVDVKAAHIVPYSFRSAALNYLFGEPEENLNIGRNGLPLHAEIEAAFDSQQITFVPVSDEEPADQPWEWKMVVLRQDLIKSNLRLLDRHEPPTYWKDLDGKTLQFLNPNRPARRYMYFRHAMAYITAVSRDEIEVVKKLPRGQVWATPARKSGYLRKSVLLGLGRAIGDIDIPADLIEGNTFDNKEVDPTIKSKDTWSSATLAQMLRAHIDKLDRIARGEDDDDSDLSEFF